MNTKRKKALRTDAETAARALGRILDGGHDFRQLLTFSTAHADTLRDSCLDAMCGLGLLEALLRSEIGTDNL